MKLLKVQLKRRNESLNNYDLSDGGFFEFETEDGTRVATVLLNSELEIGGSASPFKPVEKLIRKNFLMTEKLFCEIQKRLKAQLALNTPKKEAKVRTVEEIREALIKRHIELRGRKIDLVNANPKLEAPKTKEYRQLTEEWLEVWSALEAVDEAMKKVNRLATLKVIEL